MGSAGGLKAHHAPLFISCDKSLKMPVAGPSLKKLNLENIFLVTQRKATSTKHRDAFLEVVRVDDIERLKQENELKKRKIFWSG